MLTYALGRGLEYYDVEAVDQIVARLEKADGRASALMLGSSSRRRSSDAAAGRGRDQTRPARSQRTDRRRGADRRP